ncbi:MAG TPA: MauE/DoxX family redox-associated membrane protein, partial [Ilumatobacteraceae bacterium]
MVWVAIFARAVVGIVFVAAGAGKLADRAGPGAGMADFGVPARFTTAAGYTLSIVELIVAALVIADGTAAWGASAAAALLLLFSIVIARSLARGATPDCHCFGAVHSAPMSHSLLWRDLGLAAIAIVVAVFTFAHHGRGALADVQHRVGTTAVVLGAALIVSVFALVVMAGALRRLAGEVRTLRGSRTGRESRSARPPASAVTPKSAAAPASGPLVGSVAPAFTLVSSLGTTVAFDGLLRAGRPVLACFVTGDCAPCRQLVSLVDDWQRADKDQLTYVVITRGDEVDNT